MIRSVVLGLQWLIWQLVRYWYTAALLLAFIILGLAFLAPALMAADQPDAARVVYGWLAPHDHQLPQRSYFLFGRQGLVRTYSLEQLLAWDAQPYNLRAFVGNADIGFKMGMNHRMVAAFVAIFGGGLVWGLAHQRPRLGPVLFLLLTLPLLIDGFSHRFSEMGGTGYRADNAWAATLTGHAFPDSFYRSDAIGSLNWLLRTVTGLAFGLGLVWFLFTYLSLRFYTVRLKLEPKLRRAGVIK